MLPPVPSEIRRALLDEHARLRRSLSYLVELAERITAGEPLGKFLVEGVVELRHALREHNENEERHLDELLLGADSWGPLRVQQMMKEHIAEHVDMRTALRADNPQELARSLPGFARKLRAHMEEEERTFLSRDVLRDDLVTTGPVS